MHITLIILSVLEIINFLFVHLQLTIFKTAKRTQTNGVDKKITKSASRIKLYMSCEKYFSDKRTKIWEIHFE